VYTKGRLTADLDVYEIDASNFYNPCTISNGQNDGAYCNYGKARFSGVEGEAAYALPFGLTVFANGSLNGAKQLADANPPPGGSITAAQNMPGAPKWTYAGGLLFSHGKWDATLTYKDVGSFVEYGANAIHLPGYDTVNGSLSYKVTQTFGLKFQVSNLFDRRAITSYTPSSTATQLYANDASIYTFQAGRELSVTLIGKF
jgi:iron complex outermembrane receptor protein